MCKTFVYSKLEGAALECVPADPASVDVITNALKENIKPDSSDVISGRLQALKANFSSLNDYAKKAEDLAEAFQRVLVIEGIPLSKAREMTVKETVKLCRANAQCDIVKAALISTQFAQPKDVIAKFIVESANAKEEKQIRAYKAINNDNNNYNNRGNRNRGNFNKQNRNFYQNNNYNQDNGNFRGNGYRGRGRGNRGIRGNRYYYNNNRNNNNYGNNPQNMRFMTENAPGSSQGQPPGNNNNNDGRQEQIRFPL